LVACWINPAKVVARAWRSASSRIVRNSKNGKRCARIGRTTADVALAWLLHNPVVTAPIIGPRTMEQLDGSLRATEIQLSDETMKQLDEIFPGFKPSPEGYAW
jgi:aryl-alcohol dehydrogenase-like predicted oxidoreductase